MPPKLSAVGSGAAKKRTRAPKRPDQSAAAGDLQDWLQEGLGVLSVFVAWWICRHVEPPEVQEEAIKFLAMSPDEVEAIAEPLANILSSTEINHRYGKQLVRSNDYLKLLVAVFSYGYRVYPFLKEGVIVRHVVSGTSQPVQPPPPAASSNGAGPVQPGIPLANII